MVKKALLKSANKEKIMRIHHVALIASDYNASKYFYTQILGLKILAEAYRAERDSWKCDLAAPDGHYLLELFSFPNPPPRPNAPEACGLRHLAFAVENVHHIRAQLQAKGVDCEAIRIDEYTQRAFFFIKDPDGQPIEFYEI